MLLSRLRWIKVIHFGVGGTGSWLTPMVSKFLNSISMRFSTNDLVVDYTLIDPDYVEDRNIIRQNFNNEDVGRNKASVHRLKNMRTFSRILPIYREFKSTKSMLKNIPFESSLNIVFGSVDSNKIRREIYKFSKDNEYPTVYIDGGNDVYHGQVVTSAFNIPDGFFNNQNEFSNPKFYKIFDLKNEGGNQQDCAFFGDQTMGINIMSATQMFMNMQQLLINETIPPNYKHFNSTGFSMFDI